MISHLINYVFTLLASLVTLSPFLPSAEQTTPSAEQTTQRDGDSYFNNLDGRRTLPDHSPISAAGDQLTSTQPSPVYRRVFVKHAPGKNRKRKGSFEPEPQTNSNKRSRGTNQFKTLSPRPRRYGQQARRPVARKRNPSGSPTPPPSQQVLAELHEEEAPGTLTSIALWTHAVETINEDAPLTPLEAWVPNSPTPDEAEGCSVAGGTSDWHDEEPPPSDDDQEAEAEGVDPPIHGEPCAKQEQERPTKQEDYYNEEAEAEAREADEIADQSLALPLVSKESDDATTPLAEDQPIKASCSPTSPTVPPPPAELKGDEGQVDGRYAQQASGRESQKKGKKAEQVVWRKDLFLSDGGPLQGWKVDGPEVKRRWKFTTMVEGGSAQVEHEVETKKLVFGDGLPARFICFVAKCKHLGCDLIVLEEEAEEEEEEDETKMKMEKKKVKKEKLWIEIKATSVKGNGDTVVPFTESERKRAEQVAEAYVLLHTDEEGTRVRFIPNPLDKRKRIKDVRYVLALPPEH